MLHFLSLQSDRIGALKDFHGRNGSHCNCTNLADTTLVPAATTDGLQTKLHITKHTELTNSSKRASAEPPAEENETGSLPCVGNPLKVEAYQKTLKPFYCLHGENPLKNNIRHILRNGCHFVIKEKLIFLKQM